MPSPPSAASATATTRRSAESVNGLYETELAAAGARDVMPSNTSNWRPSPGSTGSTTAGCTANSATSPTEFEAEHSLEPGGDDKP